MSEWAAIIIASAASICCCQAICHRLDKFNSRINPSCRAHLALPLLLAVGVGINQIIIFSQFGSFKGFGEYIKLNGVLEEGRLFIGGNETGARDYYTAQVPEFQNLSTSFTLRRSWEFIGHPGEGASWEEMLSFRVQRMAEMLEREDIHDFLIEKDKCFMYNFFESQAIPYVPMYGIFRKKEAALGATLSLLNSTALRHKAIYLKACHLTQGSDDGTLQVKMEEIPEGANAAKRQIETWIRKKMSQKPKDFWRPWSLAMNKLLDTVRPGMLIQKQFEGPFGDVLGLLPKPIEAKVEVIWGRAYLAFLHDYKVFALRDGTFEKYNSDVAGNVLHISVPDTELTWLKEDDDYLTPVFELAELVARKIGVDQLRVDIFIKPGNPEHPVVNEISLASGVLHRHHAKYMARLW
eukprot:CAMPEP_0184487712 /NCGR_PEP_ID=MMETSP0113_2-20130426/10282_1 /TAXON_ID=91329 /ORGANISM="Norrisiella sphaerica, Strain BC52" /LENGTH=407 /DNA_ID=CAMNT_0026870101 /DNA_START=241 /DNA_END=1461 /DNA_ORIENTATION=+